MMSFKECGSHSHSFEDCEELNEEFKEMEIDE